MLGQILRLPKRRNKDVNMKGNILHWNFYNRNKDMVLCQCPKSDHIDTWPFIILNPIQNVLLIVSFTVLPQKINSHSWPSKMIL